MWAVSFYPFKKPGVDPIFAIVGYRRVGVMLHGHGFWANILDQILICRPAQSEGKTMEVIRSIADLDVCISLQYFRLIVSYLA